MALVEPDRAVGPLPVVEGDRACRRSWISVRVLMLRGRAAVMDQRTHRLPSPSEGKFPTRILLAAAKTVYPVAWPRDSAGRDSIRADGPTTPRSLVEPHAVRHRSDEA